MKKTVLITLITILALIPIVYAAPTSWYKQQAINQLTATHPELPESNLWNVWVISPVYSSPKPHRNVMIEYSGTYQLTWTGHVYDDGTIQTVTYSTTYIPPKQSHIELRTTIKNPQYRMLWDGKGWVENIPTVIPVGDRVWVIYPKP